VQGDTSLHAPEEFSLVCMPYDSCLLNTACSGTLGEVAMDGPQAYYVLSTQPDTWYKATLTSSYYGAYLYLFTSGDCAPASIEADCQSLGSTGDTSPRILAGKTQAVYYRSQAGEDLYIAVDGRHAEYGGPFDLTVEEFLPPTNNSCYDATPLSLASGEVTVEGELIPSLAHSDEWIDCVVGNWILCSFRGAQVYYTFTALPGMSYAIRLTPTSAAALGFYVTSRDTTTACSLSAREDRCASGGAAGDCSRGGLPQGWTQPLIYHPEEAGAQIVAVTSWGDSYGSFRLEIEERIPPKQSRCLDAQQIWLVPGETVVTDTTADATNEYGFGVNCQDDPAFLESLWNSMAGPQLYYALDLEAGETYTFSAPMTDLYIFPEHACGEPWSISYSCRGEGDGAFMERWGGPLPFTPETSGTYILAVDSRTPEEGGDFELSIQVP
jgi:hypothetical protein